MPSMSERFEYVTSNANSTREAAQIQLRRRLHSGLTALLQYTFSKSIDDAAAMGGGGSQTAQTNANNTPNSGSGSSSGSQNGSTAPMSAATPLNLAIAQNWLDLSAERGLSNFDQRHAFSLQIQYTTGMGLRGGTLLSGWKGALLKEWTFATDITASSGLPLTPIYLAAVPGTGVTGSIRPNYTGAPLYSAPAGLYLNPAAYAIPLPGQWGNAGRNIDRRSFPILAECLARAHVPTKRSAESRSEIRFNKCSESRELHYLEYHDRQSTVWVAFVSECDAKHRDRVAPKVLMHAPNGSVADVHYAFCRRPADRTEY